MNCDCKWGILVTGENRDWFDELLHWHIKRMLEMNIEIELELWLLPLSRELFKFETRENYQRNSIHWQLFLNAAFKPYFSDSRVI